MYTLRSTIHKAIDNSWYNRLLKSTEGIDETFVILEPNQDYLDQERQKFFAAGCRRNPDLRQVNISARFVIDRIQGLKRLQDEIEEKEQNSFIRVAYNSHIHDYIVGLQLLEAVANKDHQTFIQKNVELYGVPDKTIFSAACTWLRQDIQASLSDTSELSDLGNEVLMLLPDEIGDPSLLLPDSSVFAEVRDAHFVSGGYFDQLFSPAGLPDQAYIEQHYGDSITNQAIVNVGATYDVVPASNGLWSILSRKKQVVRPLGYRVDRDYFTGVIAHEIGSHLLEEANGSRQPLRLLALGLHGFEKGNEGRAYLREQIVYLTEDIFVRQPSWEYILILHVSVCLASGLTGTKYTFAELYQLLFAIHRFWRQRRYPMDTNNEAQAQEESWQLAVRIMKGTDGTGGCYMKDTVYLEGNVACWKIAASDPQAILRGDKGKFNITDPMHISILEGLGILKPK